MITDPGCPVCEERNWQSLGTRTYRSASPELPEYYQKRLSILFTLWCTGLSEVTLTSILCKTCGFVCYTPRPSEEDIARKYAFICEDASTRHEIDQNLDSDDRRSNDLFKRVSKHLGSTGRVLDFGGGNGRLMRAFLDAGHDCYLVDFPGQKIDGITYLGSDLRTLDAGIHFDLIVASHVLEHLADPGHLVRDLRPRLSSTGILFIEVPLEIWNGLPLPEEPVTHVNYFTVESLRILLQRSGFNVLQCEEGTYITETGSIGMAIRAKAELDNTSGALISYEGNADATMQLVHPGMSHRIIRSVRYPRKAYQDFRVRLLKRFGKTPLLWRIFRFLPKKL